MTRREGGVQHAAGFARKMRADERVFISEFVATRRPRLAAVCATWQEPMMNPRFLARGFRLSLDRGEEAESETRCLVSSLLLMTVSDEWCKSVSRNTDLVGSRSAIT